MAERRKLSGSLALAIGLHAVLIGVLLTLKLREKPLPPEPPTRWIEVEMPKAPSGVKAEDGTHRAALGAFHGPSGHFQTRERGATATVIEPTPDVAPSASTEPPPAPMVLDPSAIGLSGPGSFRFDVAKDAPLAVDENTRIADNVHHAIMDPILEHERQNGTLSDGPIANELERSTRASNTSPFEGRAVFSVRIDELGLVVGAQVVEASSDMQGWQDVATRMFNALAEKRIHLPHGAKGMVMRVEVTSKVVYPSGASHPITAQLGGPVDPSSPSLPLFSGSFDLSDIGTHPMRVVGSRVLSETAF